jgi:hypothetical protein
MTRPLAPRGPRKTISDDSHLGSITGYKENQVTVTSQTTKETDMPENYEIIIRGQLDQRWSDWFAGLNMTHLEGNETLLSGELPDQAALHGVLERIRDLNLTLISVTRVGSTDQDPDPKVKTT